MDVDSKASLDRRLARIEGQIAGIRRMIAEDRYCVDTLTLLAAAKGALDQAGAEIVAHHMKHCILGHGTGSEHQQAQQMSKDELIEELRTTLSRLMK